MLPRLYIQKGDIETGGYTEKEKIEVTMFLSFLKPMRILKILKKQKVSKVVKLCLKTKKKGK